MSGEIKIIWDTDLSEGDFVFTDNDLEAEDGLTTSVIISLFTDARALDDDVLPDPQSTDRRGWWGDTFPEIENDKTGSRLWLLEREKTTNETLSRAKQYAEEALAWMLEDSVVSKINVVAERTGSVTQPILALLVEIFRTNGEPILLKFQSLWENQENAI
jgi:phage gp46-like protein